MYRIVKFCLLSGLLLFPINPLAQSSGKALVVGIFPRRNATETTRMFSPLVSYLAEVLDRKIVLSTTKDFQAFWESVQNKKYDIVHFNQYHYVKSHKEQGYQVIVKNIEFGSSTIKGSIIVRKDSAIHSADDLAGKSILFGGGPKAMMSYIVATYLLRQAGLKPSDYVENFSKNPPNAIIATYYGQFDAAGSGDRAMKLNVVNDLINVDEMRFLLRSEELPQLPWAVKRNMQPSLKRKLQKILTGLAGNPQGKTLLSHAQLDGFEIATDAEFNTHRAIIKKVLGETY